MRLLNAYLSEKHRAVVRPPKVLERLGLVKPGTVWHLKRALYGLRVSPMEWQQERDKAMDGDEARSSGWRPFGKANAERNLNIKGSLGHHR